MGTTDSKIRSKKKSEDPKDPASGLSQAIVVAEPLQDMRNSNKLFRVKYQDQLLELYQKLKSQALSRGSLYFSIKLDPQYITFKESINVRDAAKADGLTAVWYNPERGNDTFLVFCDPDLYTDKYGLNEKIIDMYDIKYNSAKLGFKTKDLD